MTKKADISTGGMSGVLDSEVPVQWGARYFPSAGDLVPIARSLSADSLLGALLQKSGTNPRDAGYFTYLGALAELRISVEQRTAPNNAFRLTDALLEIEYEFVRRGASLRTLTFSTAESLAPYVEVSTADLGGRQDGLGQFTRTYQAGTPVTMSVPDRIGNLRFVAFANLLEPSSLAPANYSGAITIQRNLRPMERHMPSVFDGSHHRLEVIMSSDLRLEARYEAIESLSLGISPAIADGALVLDLDGERATPYRLETAPAVTGPWFGLETGVLYGPEQRVYPTPESGLQFYRLRPSE